MFPITVNLPTTRNGCVGCEERQKQRMRIRQRKTQFFNTLNTQIHADIHLYVHHNSRPLVHPLANSFIYQYCLYLHRLFSLSLRHSVVTFAPERYDITSFDQIGIVDASPFFERPLPTIDSPLFRRCFYWAPRCSRRPG